MLLPIDGERCIDVAGLTLEPEFIDMHAYVPNVHERPQEKNFLSQGVTNIASTLHGRIQLGRWLITPLIQK